MHQLALYDRLAAHKRFSQANYRHGKQGIYGTDHAD
jgi:hypothetical protein